jgi:hypothetical protein
MANFEKNIVWQSLACGRKRIQAKHRYKEEEEGRKSL